MRLTWIALPLLALTSCTGPHWHGTMDQAFIDAPEPIETDFAAGFDTISRDGRFYFSSQPTPEGLEAFADRGGRMVINLRTLAEMQEQVAFDEGAYVAEELGLAYTRMPIAPSTFGEEDVDLLADLLGQTRGPVLIHCSSSNRTGGLIAAYAALRRGEPAEEAMAIGRAAGLKADSEMEKVTRYVIENAEEVYERGWR